MPRGQRQTRQPQVEGKLSNSLVLNRYILSLFGVTSLEALSEHLKDPVLEGWDENNVSYFYRELLSRLFATSELTEEMLLAYDENIYRHTKAISEKREAQVKWKYFQYLSLLFTEIYLDKYFSDRKKLLADINTYLQLTFNADPKTYHGMTDFTESDLNKVAFWSATGSGKTLLMHVNVLQYRHYAEKYRQKPNRIILITPNEGLTMQHLEEFRKSNIGAGVFNKNTASGLFAGHDVDILEITKLGDTDGDKTVAVGFFEGNNLVLVDEGHRGSGGEAWKQRRDQLCETGFSFEYSATFGQSISAISNAAKRKDMLHEYGKATLFDYSYRYFYNDGYGKDYQILNMNSSWGSSLSDNQLIMYLTACMLNFYEQQRLYRDNRADLRPFLLENPLAVFVGGSVTADKSIGSQEVSDIVFILKFFQQFIANKQASISNIDHLLHGNDGLTDQYGHPIFARQLAYLRNLPEHEAEGIYNDMLGLVFHCSVAGAQLHLDNLKGKDGEIGMRIGNGEYFGIINVGDSGTLAKKCEEAGLNVMSKDFTEKSLFATINKPDSSVNILIGSKKFTEGWSSWRVSTMGLLNVGKSEGSQIIQLFGRGVRLKGYRFSLKRSSALDPSLQPESKPRFMHNLETLNIFGIKADYMEQFKQFLEDEGLPTNDSDWEEFDLPVLPVANLRGKRLKYLKVKDGCDFKKDEKVIIKAGLLSNTPITLDYYPKIQAMRSAGRKSILDETNATLHKAILTPEHLAFVDWNRVYFAIVDYKNERSWYNLCVSSEDIREVAMDSSWYTLFIPEPQMLFTDFGSQTAMWHEILVTLLKGYVEKVYNNAKSRWMSRNVETAYLDSSHPNFEEEYCVLMHKELFKNEDEAGFCKAINKLKQELTEGTFSKSIKIANSNDFEALYIAGHLYQPLLYLNESSFKHKELGSLIEVQPVALNRGERDFVCDIQRFFDNNPAFFADKSLYLLRNKSRKGIGFFDDSGFYPDFIVWLVVGEHQYVSFIDPKGIRNLNGFSDSKIQLYKVIREDIEPGLHDTSITLNSYIISNTEMKDVKHWVDFPELDLSSKQKKFNEHHVYFQGDQKDSYIQLILENMISSPLLKRI